MTERDDVVAAADDEEIDSEPELTDEETQDEMAEPEIGTEAASDPQADSDVDAIPVVSPEPAGEDESEDNAWQQSTGAFVLGTLDSADRSSAARAYAQSPRLQQELISIMPVADILTGLYQTQSPVTAQTDSPQVPVSSATVVASSASGTTGTARPAKAPRERSQPVSVPKGKGISRSTLIMAGLGLLAAVGLLWALAQRDQISTKDQEIQALRAQLAELQTGGNASVFVLNPVSDDVPGARATVFYSPGDGTVLLDAAGLPELDEDQVYQVWLQAEGSDEWQPGPTFRVNSSGEVVGRLAGDTPGFARMAISEEPAPGSTEPTGEFLLEGELVRTGEETQPDT